MFHLDVMVTLASGIHACVLRSWAVLQTAVRDFGAGGGDRCARYSCREKV